MSEKEDISSKLEKLKTIDIESLSRPIVNAIADE